MDAMNSEQFHFFLFFFTGSVVGILVSIISLWYMNIFDSLLLWAIFLVHPGMLIHCFFFYKGPIEYIVQQHLHNLMNAVDDVIYISQPGEWVWYL